MKVTIFAAVIKDAKRTILVKIMTKTPVRSKVMSTYLMQMPFTVYELPSLLFKRFSTIIHYSLMLQMLITFINIFSNLKD